MPALPGAPTFTEAGLPGFEMRVTYAVLAPAGTPRAIIDRLNAGVTKIMQAPDTQKQFVTFGGDVAVTTPEQAEAFVREEFTRWGTVIRDAHIKAE